MLIATPSIMLTKTVIPANDVASEDLTTGDELTYTLVIANNGNQTITDIALYDELLGGEIDLSTTTKGIDMTVIGYIPTTDDETTTNDDNENTDESVTARAYYLEHVTVSDDDLVTTLRPSEYLVVEMVYTLTQEDMNNDSVVNTATANRCRPKW